MPYLPDPPDSPPDEELSPPELRERVNETVNMTADELERLDETRAFELYREDKSGGQPVMEPINDTIQLVESEEYDRRGFDEIGEGRELLDYVDRTAAQGIDGQELGDTGITKQEMSLMTWGVDPHPRDGFP